MPRNLGATVLSLAVANNNAVHPPYRRFRAPLTRPLSSASVAIKIAETRPKNGDEGRSRNGNRIDSKQGQLAFSSCTSQSHQIPFLFEPRVETVDGIFWRSNDRITDSCGPASCVWTAELSCELLDDLKLNVQPARSALSWMRECETPLLREVRNSLTRVQQRHHGICERLPFPFS